MMSEELQSLIAEHRRTAEAAGLAAREAISLGDIGLARTAARQAAQWARVVMQLETGEKQTDAEEEGKRSQASSPDSGKMMV